MRFECLTYCYAFAGFLRYFNKYYYFFGILRGFWVVLAHFAVLILRCCYAVKVVLSPLQCFELLVGFSDPIHTW